jgi:heptosyltransferase-1
MKRVLVVRTSAIGDVVFATPLAAALRRTFPSAHITWLVEQGIEGLLAGDPAIDQVIVWPKTEWAQLWRTHRLGALLRAVRDFRARLRAERFDTALDLQGLLKSAMLTFLSGAPRRIGLDSREGGRLLLTQSLPRGGPVERISSEYLHFARLLGLDTGEFIPRLAVAAAAEAQAQALLGAEGLAPGRYAVFAPFTTRPQKHWFEDAWQELAGLIQRSLAITPVLLGAPADRQAAARIAGAGSMADLTGRTSLPQAAAVIRQAALVIGVDTGLTHIGIALNRPTIALFGSTRPYLDACRPNARVIWLGLDCSPCRRRPTCNGAFTCLRNISPARVLDEARLALAAERAR